MYFIISFTLNIAGALFAGVQFARICKILQGEESKNRDLSFLFSRALGAFAIPFYSPISHDLGATASFFIALSAVSTLVVSRSNTGGKPRPKADNSN